jgi:hypothetical protein
LSSVSKFKDFYGLNPYQEILDQLNIFQEKGAVLEELNMSLILSDDYLEILEQGLNRRNVPLLDYILENHVRITPDTVRGTDANIFGIFKLFLGCMAADGVATEFYDNQI